MIMHTQMSRQQSSFSCPVVPFRTGPILGGFQASGGQRQSRVTGWTLILSRVTRAPGSPRASRSPAKRNNITPLLQASPVDGCVKRFQRHSSLRNHLKYRKESTVNAIDCSWKAEPIRHGQNIYRDTVLHGSGSQSVLVSATHPVRAEDIQGWTLKRPPRGYSRKFGWGCAPHPPPPPPQGTLTLFQTKICGFPHPISDETLTLFSLVKHFRTSLNSHDSQISPLL